MHEVAKTTSFACAFVILTTFCLSEVCHRRELSCNHFTSIVSTVHVFHGCICLIFVLEFHVDIANHVITDVVSYNHLVELTILRQLHVNFFVEILKVLDC